jgi:hypothetical protein
MPAEVNQGSRRLLPGARFLEGDAARRWPTKLGFVELEP